MGNVKKQAGFALVAAISFVVIVGVLVGTALFLATTNRRLSNDLVRTTQAQYVAEAGVERVVRDYWYDVLVQVPTAQRNLQQYRDKLDGRLRDQQKSAYTDVSMPDGTAGKYSVEVKREDFTPLAANNLPGSLSGVQTQLKVTSTGTLPDGTTRVLNQTLTIGGALFTGLDFALLSNNVNCIFCHTKITSMADAYGDKNRVERLQRIKVASLENLDVRTGTSSDHSADTFIGGTLYTRKLFKCDQFVGNTYCDGNHDVVSPQSVDVKTYDVDDTGHVGTTKSDLDATQDCASLTRPCAANANFYRNYPQSGGVDGNIPPTFPSPLVDTDGNKITSLAEWQATVKNDTGGSLSGGSIQLVGKMAGYDATTPPQTGLNSGSSADGVDGNVVLSGTDASPLSINGTLYVNGDVVIHGKVKGNGKIIAKGNIYVVGDVEYDCSDTQQNSTCDYSRQNALPQLGLVANGNITVGDYMSARTANLNGRPMSPAQGTTRITDPNYIEPSVKVTTAGVKLFKPDGTPLNIRASDFAPSFVAAEAAVFNKKELDKARQDPNYQPRFYRMRDGDDVFYYNGNGEKPERYNQVSAIPADLLVAGARPAAQIVSLSADASGGTPWISESQLKQLWVDNIETPKREKLKKAAQTRGNQATDSKGNQNKPLQLDGLMYSSNAMFSITHRESQIEGSSVVNGAIIAADTGILSPGSENNSKNPDNPGLRLHYDSRLRNLLNLNSVLVLNRSDYTLKGLDEK